MTLKKTGPGGDDPGWMTVSTPSRAFLAVSTLLACTPNAEDVVADSASTVGSSEDSGPASGGGTVDATDGSTDGQTGAVDVTEGKPVGPCDGYEGVLTPEQTASTPRRDEEAELLALEASGEALAPDALYDRITNDLALIRRADRSIAAISHLPSEWATRMDLFPDQETIAAMVAGTYTAWDCPNELYDAVEIIASETEGKMTVTFAGRYDVNQIDADYEVLPGIERAWSSNLAVLYTSPDICAEVVGDDHFYIFTDGFDFDFDFEERRGYRVNSMGMITSLGDWVTSEPEPAWHRDRSACSQWFRRKW